MTTQPQTTFARLWRAAKLPETHRQVCWQWFQLGWQSAEIYAQDDRLGELARELNARVSAALDSGNYAEAAALMPAVREACKGEGKL